MEDQAVLLLLLNSTLDTDVNVRRTAELQLKQAEDQPGILNHLLAVVAAKEDMPAKQVAAVYMKNLVTRWWPRNRGQASISEDIRQQFRHELMPVLFAAPYQLQKQLLTVLHTILACDYPDQWPEFLDAIMRLLSTGDVQDARTGLVCLLQLCRVYRWRSSGKTRAPLDHICSTAFPPLLQIAQSLVREDAVDAGNLLRLCIKCYWCACNYELPQPLQQNDSIIPWGSLLLTVATKEISVGADDDERAANPWTKCKKWSTRTLNHLFSHYGNPSTFRVQARAAAEGNGEAAFAENFLHNFAPEILRAYLVIVERWIQGHYYVSDRCLHYICTFFEMCVKPKVMWRLLKPHAQMLVSNFIFPLLWLTREDEELWEDNPEEYVHKKIDIYDDYNSSDIAASNLLLMLARRRQKQCLVPTLTFINGVLEEGGNEERARYKEAALRMVGCIAFAVMKPSSGMVGQMETFFLRHVVPEFTSRVGYLRARACELLNRYADIEFADVEAARHVYQSLLECLNDPDLPVRVEAALALQPLLKNEVFSSVLSGHVAHVMQQLLRMSNQVDLDLLPTVMSDLVEHYPDELTPFTVEMTQQMVATFMRIMHEMDDGEGGVNMDDVFDDKGANALSILATLGTMILSLDSSKAMLEQVEALVLPVLYHVVEKQIDEMYSEVFDIVDSLTYAAKNVSENMWKFFMLLNERLRADGLEQIDFAARAFLNIITYGSLALQGQSSITASLIQTIQLAFTDGMDTTTAVVYACQLIEGLYLYVGKGLEPSAFDFMVSTACDYLLREPRSTILRVHLLETVLNAVYCDSMKTLTLLGERVPAYLGLMFETIPNFRRVHDKKLATLSLLQILELSLHGASSGDAAALNTSSECLKGVLSLLSSLPAAMKNRVLAKDFDNEEFDPYVHEAAYLDDDDEDDEDEEGNSTSGGTFGGTIPQTLNVEPATSNRAGAPVDANDKNNADNVLSASEQEYLGFLDDKLRQARRELAKMNQQPQLQGGAGDDEDDDDDEFGLDDEESEVLDTLEEDPSFETPLDSIDVYAEFRLCVNRLEGLHVLHQQILPSLNSVQQQVFAAVIARGGTGSIH